MKNKILLFSVFIYFLVSCSSYENYQKNIEFYNDPDIFHNSMQKLTDVIVYDIFSPPVASRIYVYPSIAAYEVLRNSSTNYKSLTGQLNGLDPIPEPDNNKEEASKEKTVSAVETKKEETPKAEPKKVEADKKTESSPEKK